MRILLNTGPGDGGGTPPPVPAPVPQTLPMNPVPPPTSPAPTIPPTSPAPAQPPTVPVAVDMLSRLLDQDREMARWRADQEEKTRVAERKAAEAELASGKTKEALDEFERKSREREMGLERQIMEDRATVAIADATAGIPWADDVAHRQAKQLLAGRVLAEKDGSGRYVALDRETRRPAAEVLREVANGPEFARFRKAAHAGGGGGGQGSAAPANPNPERPRTLGEAMLLQDRAAGNDVHPMMRKYILGNNKSN